MQAGTPRYEWDAVVVGAAAVDLWVRVPHIPEADEAVLADGHRRQPGGSAANVAYRLAQLGARVAFAGRVGDDPEAGLVLASLAGVGVSTAFVRSIPGGHTAEAVVLVDRAGRKAIVALGGISLFEDPTELPDAAYQTRAMYVGEAYPHVAEAILRRCRAQGVRTFYAPGLFARQGLEALRRALQEADVVLLNAQEAADLLGWDPGGVATWGQALRRAGLLGAGGAEEVVVTVGSKGAVVLRDAGYTEEPAPAIEAVDTTGAGDAFAAGSLWGVLRAWDSVRRLRFAQACAAVAASGEGARWGHLAEQALLKQGPGLA
jgi:ribokinase